MRKNPIKLNYKQRQDLERFLETWKCSKRSDANSVMQKIRVILLRDDNKSIDYIIKETGLSRRTIINYTNSFLNDDRFFVKRQTKCKSILEINNVKSIFTEDAPPLSYREAKDRIQNYFNIDISIIQVRNYLNRQGIYTPRSNHKLNYYARRKLESNAKKYKEKSN